MKNPWLDISLADYEGHMALPQVAQARLLSDVFACALGQYSPESVAVLGCAGGNGFERIDSETIERVVGVDLNPDYIRQARARFERKFRVLELFTSDVETDECVFAPVDLVFVGLLFEYVDTGVVLTRICSLLRENGILVTMVQLPHAAIPEVTPSPYASLGALSSVMHLVPPELLKQLAAERGFQEIDTQTVSSVGRKQFRVQTFRFLKFSFP
jgi:SAM-dependent methyltransferase